MLTDVWEVGLQPLRTMPSEPSFCQLCKGDFLMHGDPGREQNGMFPLESRINPGVCRRKDLWQGDRRSMTISGTGFEPQGS